MLVAIVRFPVPGGISPDKAREAFARSAPNYQNIEGLHRKYYLRDTDGSGGGGVYLWESREAAEATYTDAWKANLTERFGAKPQIEFLDCPVVVDPDQIVVS